MLELDQIDDAPEKTQDPADVLDYFVDFSAECARLRRPDTDYATSVRVRPINSTGFQYVATVGGHTGTSEPRWPTVVGATVVDGSVTWTAEAYSAASLARSLSSAAWTVDTGLTSAGAAVDAATCIASANLSGGVHGQRYLVRCQATFSDGKSRGKCFWLVIARPSRSSA